MKLELKADVRVYGHPVQAGQRVIVADEVGAPLVAEGVGLQLPEDELGAFLVLTPTD